MKKLVIIPLAVILMLYSCSKSNNVNPIKTTTITTTSSLLADSVSLYAGSISNFAFVNGPALSSTFSEPYGLASDLAGDVYVADAENQRIRKITPDGIVSTYAGNGTAGYQDGAAATAEFNYPVNVAVDASGNVYVTEITNHFIRKITPQGQVSTITEGRYGAMVADASGNLFVCDPIDHVIDEIPVTGVLQVYAGSGIQGGQDGALASAQFNSPQGIAVDQVGNVYVSDEGTNTIRKISSGKVTTLAGNGKMGFANGNGTAASFYGPKDIVLDPWGNLYVTDQLNWSVRKITPAGVVSTFAGNGKGAFVTNNPAILNGPALSAGFIFPQGLTLTTGGYFLVANGGGPFVLQKISTTKVDK